MPNGLYGIYNSNRTVNDHWGKNCFNSSFPTSAACYMLDKLVDCLEKCLIYRHIRRFAD